MVNKKKPGSPGIEWAAMALVGLLTASCGSPSSPGPSERITELPRALSAAEQEVLSASNSFAWGLLATTAANSRDASVFVSPLSASMALGMTLNGAAGETLLEMRETLGFGGLSMDAINASYRGLLDLLVGLDPALTLDIANSVWYREGFAVETPFLDATRGFFDAEVAALDFSSPSAVGTINGWVEDNTAGRIRDIVTPPIDPLTVMFLINAVYFNGPWTYEFDPGKTRDDLFRLEDGSTAPMRLMEMSAELPYAREVDVEVVELPYAGGAYAMTLLLPSPDVQVDDLLASLDDARWTELVNHLAERSATVFLPRFRLEYEKVLNDALRALGMNDAFLPGAADFTGIYRDALAVQLHVSSVKQKTFVEVTEEGTEAAAATSVEVGVTCAGCGPPTVRLDRPFVFLIRERLSGAILFAGVLRTPLAA